MKSGLYACAGASATASAAACAKRFDEPITNESKVYFGFIAPVGELSSLARRGGGATVGRVSGRGSSTVSAIRRSRPVASRTAAEMKPRKCPSIHSRVKSFGTPITKASSVSSLPPAPPNQVRYVVVLSVFFSRSETSAHSVSAVTRIDPPAPLILLPDEIASGEHKTVAKPQSKYAICSVFRDSTQLPTGVETIL